MSERFDAEFKEGDHPRDKDGKFGSGGGSSESKFMNTKRTTTATINGKKSTIDVPQHGAHGVPVQRTPPKKSFAEKRGLAIGQEVTYRFTSAHGTNGETGSGKGKVFGFCTTPGETHAQHNCDVLILDEKNSKWQFVQAVNVRQRSAPNKRSDSEWGDDYQDSTGTELDVARQIRDGVSPSPTKFGDMALFAIRITGTGLSYRTAHEEFVWRDPSLYLNEEFLARCNGLPVIWEHPTEATSLNSEEFASRVIGTVMLPYVRDDEVWAVARIYESKAIALMTEGQLSTSPAVVFKTTDGNEKVDLDDGGVMLIEGKPSYLDHLAVCEVGVWDKNGPATGVQNDNLGAAAMADEDKEKAAADAAAKHDSDIRKMDEKISAMDAKFDAVMDAVMSDRKDRKDRKDAMRKDAARKDKFGKRKDGESFKDYKDRHDAEEKAMCDALRKDSDDKEEDCMDAAKDARKDAEEEEKRSDKDFDKWAKEEEKEPEHKEDSKKDEEEEEKKDAKKDEVKEVKERETSEEDSKKDSTHSVLVKENTEMKLRMLALESQIKGIKRETPREEMDALAASQSRADAVAAMFNDRAPPATPGETPLDYRKRLIGRFKRHSDRFKEARFDSMDANTLGVVEDIVYMDAMNAARNTADAQVGTLVPYTERYGNREITKFHGDVGAFIAPFVPQNAQVCKILRPQRGH